MAAIFSDNFDTETSGDAPLNWEKTATYQIKVLLIKNTQCVSSPNSLYAEQYYTGAPDSTSGWFHNKATMQTFTDAIIEFNVRINGGGANASQCSLWLNDGSWLIDLDKIGPELNAWINGSGGAITWRYRDVNGTYQTFHTVATATWLKMRVKCNTAEKKFSVWVDDVLKVDNVAYQGTLAAFNGIIARLTTGLSSPFYMYIDDVYIGPLLKKISDTLGAINEVNYSNINAVNETKVS